MFSFPRVFDSFHVRNTATRGVFNFQRFAFDRVERCSGEFNFSQLVLRIPEDSLRIE